MREVTLGWKYLVLHLGITPTIGVCFSIQKLGITIALWPLYAQVEWNEWFHAYKLRKDLAKHA